MVFSRSDVKRRNKDVQDPLNENPKRTKVHAQRKFAQGSGMNSPVKEMNLIKEKEKAKPTDDPTEELPTNQPPTEDFLSFLCFRGTKFLAPRLNVFNEVPSSPRKNSSSSKHTASSSGAQKHKVGSSPQELKKRLAARGSGLQKGNAVRARTASNEREAVRKKAIERQIRRKAAQRRAKPIRKPHPAILKRLGATRLRAGLRSGGQLPPGSDVGLKTDRKPKRGRPRRRKQAGLKKGQKMEVESLRKKAKDEEYDEDDDEEEAENEDAEEDEDEEEEEEEPEEKSKTTRKSGRSRVPSSSPAQSPRKQSTSGRPSRKTKEAATLYMEMLTKDLRNPDEEFDEDYVRNFPELPSAIKRDKSEELKKNNPKRGRRPKRGNSPARDEKSKIRKLLKSNVDIEESSSSTLKRGQRNSATKIIPRGKPVIKVKARLLRRANFLRNRNLPQIKKSLRARRRGRPAKNLKENINDESEEDEEEEEEEDEDMEDEVIEDNRKTQSSKKSSSETISPKGMVTRKNDQKKSNEVISDKSGSLNQKKRKVVTESSSLSEDAEESEEEKPKKGNQSQEQDKKKTRVSDRRKSQKIETDNELKRTTPKRISLRNRKKESNESDSEDDNDAQSTKNPRRSKRNKDSDEDDELLKKGKFTETKKSKYKEDSDEDFDDEYDNSSKTRSSQRQKGNMKRESEDDLQRSLKKNDESNKIKTNKVNIKKNENDEIEISGPKSRGRQSKSFQSKESDEDNEPLPRRSRISDFKKTMSESDDEDEPLVRKTTRGSGHKTKTKSETDDSNKKTENDEIDSSGKKRRGRRTKNFQNKENDEDNEPLPRKSRNSHFKKTMSESDDENEPLVKKTSRGSGFKSKTKPETDDSNKKNENEDEPVKKSKGSDQKGKTNTEADDNIKIESEEDDELSLKKTTRGSLYKMKSKSEAGNSNKRSEIEVEELFVKKTTRGSVPKGKSKYIDDDNKRSESEDDEPLLTKTTRGSVSKGRSNDTDDINIKKESEDDEPLLTKTTRGSVSKGRSKNTDENNIKKESEDDEPLLTKTTRGSVSKGRSKDTVDNNIKSEDDEPLLRKASRGSVFKGKNKDTCDNNIKSESEDDESLLKKTRSSVPASKTKPDTDDNNKRIESEDDEPILKKTTRCCVTKGKTKPDTDDYNKKIESEDEEELSVKKATRGSTPKGKSKDTDDSNKSIEIEKESNNEIKKFREIQLKKTESDEEVTRKFRGLQKKTLLQKGVDINEIKIEPSHEIQNNVVTSVEIDFKFDKPKITPSRKPKKGDVDKEDSVTPTMSEVVDNNSSKVEKIISRGKAKKISEDRFDEENDEESNEISVTKTMKNIRQSKESSGSSVKPGLTKKLINSDEKESNDEEEDNCGINYLSEAKPRMKRVKKPKKNNDSELAKIDEIFKHEENINQCKIVSSSSTKNDSIETPNVSEEYTGEPKIANLKDNIEGVQKSNKKFSPNIVKKEEHSDVKSNLNLNIGKGIESLQIQSEVTYLTSDIINVVSQETIDIDLNIKKEREEYENFLESVLNEEELKRNSKKDNDIKTEIVQTSFENDQTQNKYKKLVEIKDIKLEAPISSHSSLRNNSERHTKPNTGTNDPKMVNKELLSRKARKGDSNIEGTALHHKLIKPFSHLDKDCGTKITSVSSLSNKDPDKQKQSNASLRKDISTDKVSVNAFNDKIEGSYRYDKDNLNNFGDRLNFKRSIEGIGKKAKKNLHDYSSSDEIKKNKTANTKNNSGNLKDKEIESKKSRDLKLGESSKDIPMTKRQTRLSVGSPERDDKHRRKFDMKDKYVDHFVPESTPKPTKYRKPALTARAQFITRLDNDDDDLPPTKGNDVIKPAAPLKRKTHGRRDSCDSIGSSDSSDCKVVLSDLSESIGDMSGDFRKTTKKSKNSSKEGIPSRTSKSIPSVQQDLSDEFSSKDNNCSIMSTATFSSGSVELDKTDDRSDGREKQVTKPSLSDTWRQAFKNAKIPKPGHLSPVPGKHSVKPFVRQKPPNLSGSFPAKSGGRSEQKLGETNKPKTPQNLSPFKALIANQTQRSLSPDAKKHLSPAHKANFLGFESPVKKPEEVRTDFKKQEPPVKSLTQLQYEKRSSEFINSYLDPGPTAVLSAVLPAFESIRAYKKEMKKEEPKEVVKTEPLPNPPPPLAEPAVKPSPEGKHLNLPLAVEHTLRKNSPITVSKKPPQKPVSFSQEKKTENIPVTKPILPSVITIEKKVALPASIPPPAPPAPTPTTLPSTTSSQPLPPARDLLREQTDLSSLSKKKVNMTNEEINRWLNDSTSSGIEHKIDCGIFENNQCECSYRTSEESMQNSIGVSELVTKEEKIDHGVVEPPVQLKELDKAAKYVAETISTCKVEDYKEKLISKNSSLDNKMAPPRASRRTSGHDRFKSSKSMTEDEMCEYDFRFERMSNSPRESVSDVSSVTHRDDASSSSEIPERKIFHQKRSIPAPKRPSLSSPTAFSAENESSIYAFDPDPPSTTNRPFRRGRGKSGEHDDGRHPSSSSIAVQVNLNENEAGGLECSTQTERPSDDNEGHLFYIPLPDEQLQSGLPQGVAVKLDTEGPDQRVIMRAKLVTKPNSSFPSSASTSRAFLNSSRNTQKPEQKVRPLWSGSGRAPVGTVQPTLREPEKSDQGTTTQEKSRSSSGQVSQSSQSTQINQISPKGPDSPRSSRNSARGPKLSSDSRLSVESSPASHPPTAIEWKGTEFPPADIPPTLVEAPTFYPTEKEFQDPLDYIEQLTPLAQSFGICRIVPPSTFKPECKVSDDMRFTAYNQYVHKLMERWGPNVKELCAIKKYLTTQSITLNQLPLIGSMEVDLPRLYQTVQQQGGLKEVIEKKRWARVADAMRIPKSAQDRFTKLDDIYCKYLLPYDTLSHEERTKLFEDVEEDWQEREKRRVAEDDGGNTASGDGSEESSEADDNMYECISKGKNMPLSGFFRIARNTMYMWFKEKSPSPDEVESEFWQHVSNKTYHVCVHCGSIDSGTWGYGFPTTKTSATSRHPWNLKVLTNSPGSILRSIGPLMGVTVPTLHVGMLFSSCCWYRDPHALPWIEYLHTGASKIWYGVPDSRASELRNAMYPLLPRHTRDKPIWLPSDTMMVPPQYLLEGGVSVCRVVQDPGQFILVFPKAFTSTISTGYIVSESVYFAQPSWLNTALQVFKDIQDSYEPPGFSLHKLLFSIANDARSSADILNQILPMLASVIEKEVKSRKKLEKLGLTSWEKIPSSKAGRRKKQEEEPNDLECDNCRGALFLSMVSNSNEDCSYCIDHAIENLSKEQGLLKYCKLLFAYNEEEMEELMNKVKARIESKTQKKQKEKGASTSGGKN